MEKEYTSEELLKLSEEFINDLTIVYNTWTDKNCFPDLAVSTMAINFFWEDIKNGLSDNVYCNLPDEKKEKVGQAYADSFYLPHLEKKSNS